MSNTFLAYIKQECVNSVNNSNASMRYVWDVNFFFNVIELKRLYSFIFKIWGSKCIKILERNKF